MSEPSLEKGLEKLPEEKREMALRFRRLITALGLSQQGFADAMAPAFVDDPENNPIRRTEVSIAWNGGQLATSQRWIRGVAAAASVDYETANAYLRGRIPVEQVIEMRDRAAHGLSPSLAQPKAEGTAEDVSPNAAAALEGYDWTGVDRATYNAVHEALAAEHQAGGRDPVTSFWTAEIRRLVAEARGKLTALPDRPSVQSPDEQDAAELAAEKAARRQKKKR